MSEYPFDKSTNEKVIIRTLPVWFAKLDSMDIEEYLENYQDNVKVYRDQEASSFEKLEDILRGRS